MLNSIAIKNFRNLEDLQIESVEKINLITGKNNTGKTAFLEAVALYESKGDIFFIDKLQQNRGVVKQPMRPEFYFSLFTNQEVEQNKIRIGPLNSSLFGSKAFQDNSLLIEITDLQVVPINLSIKYKNLVAEQHLLYSDSNQHNYYNRKKKTYDLELVGSTNIVQKQLGELWDNITLTDKELYVIQALKIIEKNTEKIAFVGRNNGSLSRYPIIKIKNSKTTIPLKSMGDGINRILNIILALVNVENGTLLIDELENGLHYSSQKKLWEVIFFLSYKLNIQVFATTHSYDCIRSFEETVNENKNDITANLIRLDNKNGKIVQVGFDADDLKVATENNIEIR